MSPLPGPRSLNLSCPAWEKGPLLIPLESPQLGQSIGRHGNQLSNQRQALLGNASVTHLPTHPCRPGCVGLSPRTAAGRGGGGVGVKGVGKRETWQNLGAPACMPKISGVPRKERFLGAGESDQLAS